MLQLLNVPAVVLDRYTQYPGALPPSEIFGGTWKTVFDEEGVFFRTEGGHALAFEGGVQGYKNAYHRHGLGKGSRQGTLGSWNNSFGGVLPYGRGNPDYTRQDLYTEYDGIDADDPEARPVNMTIRVWERVDNIAYPKESQ